MINIIFLPSLSIPAKKPMGKKIIFAPTIYIFRTDHKYKPAFVSVTLMYHLLLGTSRRNIANHHILLSEL
jgi:hypothetical protein